MNKPVILTGIRANNELTIGNYFGALLPMVDMAKHRSAEYRVNMFIPDLHSFTTPTDLSGLNESIMHNARIFAAAGLPIENENIHLYRQSYVPAHSELTWILDCFASFGQLSRMTQFKDKSANRADVSVGLFNYPVLMAADILLYGARYVPVGDDQTQHLEFTRDIAERMNSRFGELFIVPEPVAKQHEFFGKEQGLRIMDLLEPTKKMSKSDESGKGVIFLNDDPAEAAKKIMGAATDSIGEIRFDRKAQPGISNLLEILSLLRNQPLAATTEEFEGQKTYGDFKRVVAGEVEQFLVAFQSRLAKIDEASILAKLETSEREMNIVANQTLLKVQQAVGLRPKG